MLHLRRCAFVVLLCALTLPTLFGQDLVIRVGHLIDPASGSVANNQVIVVHDGKIVSVGANATAPKNASAVDLSNEWVMPGMIDAHTHITMNLPVNPPGESLWESYLLKESSGLRVARGLHNAELLLRAGFTAVRDVGNNGNYGDVAVRDAIDKGWFVGPTVIPSGKIIAAFGGQSHGYAPEQGRFWDYEYLDADTPDEVRKAVRQNIYYGAQVIKLVADNSNVNYSVDEVKAAVAEAHAAGLKVAVHVYGGKAADNVIAAGVDSIEHGWNLTDEQLRAMKERNITLVGTDFPHEHLVALGNIAPLITPDQTFANIVSRLKRAYSIGTKMAFGADVVVDLPGKSRADMAEDYLTVFRTAGIPNAYVLKMLTTNASELLGIEKERGAIAPGQAADIVAMPANPLENTEALRHIDFVAKDGKIVRQPQP